MSAGGTPRRSARADPAAARPADDRADPGRPVRARGAPAAIFADEPQVFQHIGAAAARALPVHLDVPGHVGDDAARADVRDARAADDDAAREARPARRLRARLRRCSRSCRRRSSRVARLRAARPRRRRAAVGGRRCSRSRTRCSAWRSGLLRQRVRDARSSRRCSSCRRSCCRSCCSAGCSSAADEHGATGCRWSLRRCR